MDSTAPATPRSDARVPLSTGTKLTLMEYNGEVFAERELSIEECPRLREGTTTTWINVDGLGNLEALERLGECFHLHPLTMEDILNVDQRPKLEDLRDYIYIVVNMLYYDEETDNVTSEQVSLALGDRFVLSFQASEAMGDVFDRVRERIRSDHGWMRQRGADFLAYSLLDAIVDSYFAIMERLGERVEYLEEELVSSPQRDTLRLIHGLKRSMILLRRSVWPLREVVSGLERSESPLVKSSTSVYLRDLYDHTIEIIETLESLRDMVSGMLDIYLSGISNRLNEVMKVLTIITTIFMPLSFIAGVYGMNFRYMPEIGWPWSYPLVLVIMLGVVVFMLAMFRRRKWL